MKIEEKNLSDLTDHELLQEAKKIKSASIINAVFIGFLIGVVIYSLTVNRGGFFVLVPVYLAYKLINRTRYNNKELQGILKERKLK